MEEKLSHCKSSSGTLFSLVDGDIHIDPIQANRSISVTGIPEGTKAADLVIHFQRNKNGGGDVDGIITNKQGSAVITFEKAEVVKSVLEKTQTFDGIVLDVQPYVTVPMVDEEVFELVSAEICLATVEFLTRQQTKAVLKEIANKTGIKWLEDSATFLMSGSLKQVEMSRGYLQQAISQFGGIAEYNEMKRKFSKPQNSRSAEVVREDAEGEVERTNAVMKANNTKKKDPCDEETDATQTDHMAPVTPTKSHDFEVNSKLIKVFVKAHEAELNDIEVEYHVEVPREAKEGKITLKPRSGCTGEEYEKACDLFIDLYQQMTQVMKMERFSLKDERKVTTARKKIHEMGKNFPVLVEVCKDKKHWEVFGRQHDLEEAMEYLHKEEVEIEMESEKRKLGGDSRNDGQKGKEANPSEFARVTRSKDLLEAHIGRVRVSVSRGDLTTEKVDAIVNASNEFLQHDGGLAKAILDKGGKIISQESNKIIKKRRSLKEGQAVSTKSGNLPCKLVVHAVGPEYRRIGMSHSKEVLRRACFNSLRIAQEEKSTSIALPAIGSGTHGMPKDACAEVMFDAVDEFIRQGDPKKKTITDIRFVNIDDASFQAFRKEFISRYGHNGDDGRGSFLWSPTGAEGADPSLQPSRRNRGRNKDKSSEASGTSSSPRDVSGNRNFETNSHHPLDAAATGGSSLPNISYSGAVKKSADANSDERKMGFTLPPGENKTPANDKGEDPCPICLDTLTKPRKLKCRHTFCAECLKKALDASNKCPVCQEPQGVLQGNQPPGEMRHRTERYSVPGYEGDGTIVVDYDFPPGIQGKNHPHPGQRFGGTTRQAYLPDTREGREVLQLLRRAFDARLVFTVGTSNTTGCSNQITWNGIHHKTSMGGGPYGFGYPDSDYMSRVKEELAAKGIR
ncbi:uncharacterized protein LOC111344503 [Stylophora pistillata]|uniref:E3 ubiquitin-protein ligase n=1 Tax=Stylophora pistillata TaxID=50429 RepID=A0A2B4R8I6_STYPI|nr:uncharacterized protein LOC111344503 [Stylophora pistillata]PFX14654.1 E3 ubiquitin-protein ligase DTX3L [Stylophora pistillata]